MATKAGGRWGVQSPLLAPGGVQEGLTPFPHLERVTSVSGLSDQSPASTDRSLNWANKLQSQDLCWASWEKGALFLLDRGDGEI